MGENQEEKEGYCDITTRILLEVLNLYGDIEGKTVFSGHCSDGRLILVALPEEPEALEGAEVVFDGSTLEVSSGGDTLTTSVFWRGDRRVAVLEGASPELQRLFSPALILEGLEVYGATLMMFRGGGQIHCVAVSSEARVEEPHTAVSAGEYRKNPYTAVEKLFGGECKWKKIKFR